MTLHFVYNSVSLGLGRGIFQYRRIVITGLLAWLMHRGYHVLAVPSWERKVRVLAIWLTQALFGRDILSLASVQHPRDAFVAGGEPPMSFAPAAGLTEHDRTARAA
jgi:NADH dehydrogenase